MKKLTIAERCVLADVALGKQSADKVICNGTLVNVHTLEIYRADIAIKNGLIVFVGDVSHTIGENTQKIDATGMFLVPGLIDCHLHIAGSQLSMTEFGKIALLHGATSITTDFYEFGVVAGKKGIRFCLDELKATGVKPLFAAPLPAYHQNESFENTGYIKKEDIIELLQWEDCYGLNEVNMERLAGHQKEVEEMVYEAMRLGKPTVGHGAGIRGRKLQAALNFVEAIGDHECLTWDEVNEKARLGVSVELRDGSVGTSVRNVIADASNKMNTVGDFAFSTDEVSADRIVNVGYMDLKVKMTIAAGAPPALAIRAGSLNAARIMGLDTEIGSITPGKYADILFVKDLSQMNIHTVLVNGEAMVQDGRYLKTAEPPEYPDYLVNTMFIDQLTEESFKIEVPSNLPIKTRVLKVNNGSLISEDTYENMNPVNGYIESDESRDIIKLAIFERHQRTGRKGICLTKGYQLKGGAIASSFNICAENLVVLGSNDKDMMIAANYIIDHKGGFVVVKNGEVINALDLPIAGVASTLPYQEVADRINAIHKDIEEMGCVIEDPFHSLAIMVYPTQFPTIKLSTYGLVDVRTDKLVDLFESDR